MNVLIDNIVVSECWFHTVHCCSVAVILYCTVQLKIWTLLWMTVTMSWFRRELRTFLIGQSYPSILF